MGWIKIAYEDTEGKLQTGRQAGIHTPRHPIEQSRPKEVRARETFKGRESDREREIDIYI